MIILGCITKYKPDDIRPFVESIEQTGYKGKKIMMVYEVPQETIDKIKKKGWVCLKKDYNKTIKYNDLEISTNY